MVQCSVLEYARRAVTVRRAENRVQCSAGGSGVLVEWDLEVECVGLQSQREAVNGVGLRAGGVGLGGGISEG